LAPQCGTIWKYVRNTQVYLCPAEQNIRYKLNYGSNGYFDYVAFGVWTGALTTKIKQTTRYVTHTSKDVIIATPIICEEDGNNKGGINGDNVEGLHNYTDAMKTIHRGGAYYATLDGSVRWQRETPAQKGGLGAEDYFTIAPSGKEINIGNIGGYDTLKWGWWNKQ